MNTEQDHSDDGQEGAFEEQLRCWQRAALLDEQLHEQFVADLKLLPPEGQAKLKASERAMLEEELVLSPAMRERLLAMKRPLAKAVEPWWKRWLARNWADFFLPGPWVSLPLASLAGTALGVVLTLFMLREEPLDAGFRGSDVPKSPIANNSPASTQGEIDSAVRDDPEAWWAAIQTLADQGQVVQVQEETAAFLRRYKDYRPKPRTSPPSP